MPALFTVGGAARMGLALKSGNFGGVTFFADALGVSREKKIRALVLHEMPPEIIREVLRFSAEQDVTAQIYQDDAVISERASDVARGYVNRHKLPFIIDPDIRTKTYHNVPKVLAFAPLERQDTLFAAYKKRFAGIAQVTRSSPGFIEINCLGITKASALEELAGMLVIPREMTAAIGDNFLDQEMIEWSGVGVCVADGCEGGTRRRRS